MSWQDSAAEIRQALKDAIPEKWTLKESPTQGLKDVTGVPATCGLLSQANLNITEQTASDLAPSLASGELSAVSVTDAFCGRAAVAHQLVRTPELRSQWVKLTYA